jgi:hypothetical protein
MAADLFFAHGQGIDFDRTALTILRAAQPRKSGIDDYAIFGLALNGQPDGLRGSYLPIEGALADQFIAWLEARTEEIGHEDEGEECPGRETCRPRRRKRCEKVIRKPTVRCE